MKLSIITINYNNCKGLLKTIQSVVSQTFRDYEWIVIDGGSIDGSKELILQYADKFSFWCSEPDNGIYNAMNKGIEKAKGEYLQFLNSGDFLYSADTLEQVFKIENGEDLLYGDFKLQDHQYVKQFPDKISFSYIINDCLNHQASFYRMSLFDSEKYDESFKIVSDWAFTFHLVLQNKKFKHIPFVVVQFEPGGIGSQLTESHLDEKRKALEKHIPQALQDEVQIVKVASFVKHRKSFRVIVGVALKICQRLEPILRKIETKSCRNDS